MEIISNIFLLFIAYSILGWIVESTYCSIFAKKFINRGFLIGPYCPIYGVAAVIIVIFLSGFKNNILILFLLSMLLSGIVEYFTSFVLEKIFKLTLWDYSKNKFNINGRVCLRNLLLFGILAIAVIEAIQPAIEKLYSFLSPTAITIILIIATVVFFTDIILTIIAVTDIVSLAKEPLNLDGLTIARGKVIENVQLDIEVRGKEFKEDIESRTIVIKEKATGLKNLAKSKSRINLNFIHKRFVKAYPNLKPTDSKKSLEYLKQKVLNRK